ncbi:MAG: adenylyl-sulfate kinase [Rhizobiaceae bacterium]
MHRKILIMGLPGAGKTTLAKELAPLLNAVIFNADEVREHINSDLGFSVEDRIEHAKRMGWMCDRVVDSGGTAIADFICPTSRTRAAFGDCFVIWVDRIKAGRFEDTNKLFEPPEKVDFVVNPDGSPRYWAEQVMQILQPVFDPQKPTALFIGRYQPFHPGHLKLIEEGLSRVDQCCIAVRDTHGMDDENPLGFFEVKRRIEAAMRPHAGKYVVVPLPNITDIFYGRDVGYSIEEIDLDAETKAISATKIRNEMA